MEKQVAAEKAPELKKQLSYVHQCRHCFTIYDESFGDLEKGAAPGTAFESLDEDYHCPLCDADKSSYTRIEKAGLELQTI
ncbi:MAG: rubredoxin [Sediminibacterium magnilacihabitans]|nr:rubredoxin [Hydrobacter penzbergensis]MBN8720047.1 rubredoxin [Sediminibacterium magnilacihabitans]